MRLFGFAGVIAGLLVASAAGQDAIEIKVAHPKAGERVKVTVEEKSETKSVVNVKGMEQAKNEVKTKSLVYVDEVIEVAAGAKKPTKLKRTYEKAVAGTDGKKTTLSVEGKTVLVEKKGDKYAFTADGKAVEGDALKMLEGEFIKSGGKDDPRDLMFPKGAVKPGDSWKLDTDVLGKELGDNKDLQLDTTKLTGAGKLVKAYKQDGRQFGVIEVKIGVPVTGLGPKVPIKLKEGTMSITFTGEGVIDGSVPQGKSVGVVKIKVSGGGEGFDLDIESTNTETRTLEPLPKK
jgi:hypothetical protein